MTSRENPTGDQVYSKPSQNSRYQNIIQEEDDESEAPSSKPAPFYMNESSQFTEMASFSATQAMDEQMDNENFTQRLDQLILSFRKETMQEFIRTKGRIQ